MRNALIDLNNKAHVENESTWAFSLVERTNNTGEIIPEHEMKQKQLEIEHLKSKIIELDHEERLLQAKLGTLDLKRFQLESKINWLKVELSLSENLETHHG